MPRTVPGRIMVGGRMLFGEAFFVAPRPSMRALGLSPQDNPQAVHWARLFGIRDAALGLGILGSRGDARRLWWRLGMLCDAGDAAAGVLSWRRGELPREPISLVLYTGSALMGVAFGGAALAGDDG